MSVHLVGGGRDLDAAANIYGGFAAECAQRAVASGRDVPRIGVVVVAEREDLDAGVDWFRQALERSRPVEVVSATAELTGELTLAVPDARWWAGLDGLVVGGGLTPAYHRVLQPHAVDIAAAVADGLPYAGFSAGAMVAPARALLGGWRIETTPVTHEDNAEDLDEITVVDGLGLISSTVEVHTSQWGTLSRLVAAVAAGLATSGIAVDENTVVILDPTTDDAPAGEPAPGRVLGAGQAWFLTTDDGAVRVDRRTPTVVR